MCRFSPVSEVIHKPKLCKAKRQTAGSIFASSETLKITCCEVVAGSDSIEIMVYKYNVDFYRGSMFRSDFPDILKVSTLLRKKKAYK